MTSFADPLFWDCDCGVMLQGRRTRIAETRACADCGRTYRIRMIGTQAWRVSLELKPLPAADGRLPVLEELEA